MPKWQQWQPDPMDALGSSTSPAWRRGADVVSMLIGIYGSKEVFINEYRQLLANRLLTQPHIDVSTCFASPLPETLL